jgi:hypothetical protein
MEAKTKIEKITGMEKLQEGAKEFMKLIYSMKDLIKEPDKTIIFISGMVGYSCQAALIDKKQSYNLVKLTTGKNYIFGDALNYYLLEAKISFYNILMGQYAIKIPRAEPIQIKPVLTRIASSLGFDTYLIGNKFHPEKIFDFELYRSTWKKFYDTLIKYCSNSDEWPVLFSISLTQFLDLIDICLGRNGYANLANIAFENAVYVSKISQI